MKKGWTYRVPRCQVCGAKGFAGTQSRPLCRHCQQEEINNHIDYCCECGVILNNVPDNFKGLKDLLCVDCVEKERKNLL